MSLSQLQIDQLLKPINPSRVAKDGKNHAHLPSWDVIAHLTRTFGFGGFDTSVITLERLYEEPRTNDAGKPTGRWDTGYMAVVRLTVKDDAGAPVAIYEDASTGVAQNQARGDAHDLAIKSAVSGGLKRAARNLGDQFGLSLYRDGSTAALVLRTLTQHEDAQEKTP